MNKYLADFKENGGELKEHEDTGTNRHKYHNAMKNHFFLKPTVGCRNNIGLAVGVVAQLVQPPLATTTLSLAAPLVIQLPANVPGRAGATCHPCGKDQDGFPRS